MLNWKALSKSKTFAKRLQDISIAVSAGILITAMGTGDVGASEAGKAELLLASSKSRIVTRLGPYKDARRWQIYTALNKEYLRLWGSKTRKILSTTRTSTFRGFSYLHIEDRNGDGIGDSYIYTPEQDGGQTQEFGAFFDLANDGTPDWLVFNGGVWIAEGEALKITYWSHHAIDRNNDGKFDTLVLDCVDMDGDKKIVPGQTAWIYDANFDGKFDSAQHIYKGKVTKVQVVNGHFDLKIPQNAFQKLRVGSPFEIIFDIIGKDIAASL